MTESFVCTLQLSIELGYMWEQHSIQPLCLHSWLSFVYRLLYSLLFGEVFFQHLLYV